MVNLSRCVNIIMKNGKLFRVLSIDGGGMRGYYSAAYLQELLQLAKNRFEQKNYDFITKFDLIVGTSTGAILGAGLLTGLTPKQIMSFYEANGVKIFPKQLPSSKFSLLFHPRKQINRRGNKSLRDALMKTFGNKTLGEIYQTRGIAFAIPTVDAITQVGRVFKTPHNQDSNHRDDQFSLVDICLASSAAPIYRSLAVIKHPESGANHMFVDGGLWANNPILVALSEALRMTKPDQKIEIYCLGNTLKISGSALDINNPHWGLIKWEFGGRALKLSLDTQMQIYEYLANSLTSYLDRNVLIVRFPQVALSNTKTKLFELDSVSNESLDLMIQLATKACDKTNQIISENSREGKAIESLLVNS